LLVLLLVRLLSQLHLSASSRTPAASWSKAAPCLPLQQLLQHCHPQ
jgi:hypothetical protein